MVKLGYTREEIMSQLQNDIEELHRNSETWLEAIIEYCTKHDLEESEIIQYLSPVMIERIRSESQKRNLFKRPPIDEVSLPF